MQGRKTTQRPGKQLSRLTTSDRAPYGVHVLDSWEAFLDMITDSPHLRELDPREPGKLHQHFLAADTPLLWIGEPEVMNLRLTAQSGTFAIPGTL